MPITSREYKGKSLPTHVKIKPFAGLRKNSTLMFEQIRAIDKKRLREYIGTLDRRFILAAEQALHVSVGMYGL